MFLYRSDLGVHAQGASRLSESEGCISESRGAVSTGQWVSARKGKLRSTWVDAEPHTVWWTRWGMAATKSFKLIYWWKRNTWKK